jgi:hypothetical protein
MASIQLALVVTQYYSLMNVTRDTARWLAIRPDTVDSAVMTRAQANALTLTPSRITSLAVNPSCTSLNGGLCANHTSGSIVTVTTTYDMSNLLFLPHQFQMGSLQVAVPTTLPPYAVSVMIE